MSLIEKVKKSQSRNRKTRELYTKELFEFYKEYFFKLFSIHSPFNEEDDTVEFVSDLLTELLEQLGKIMGNFQLKKKYTNDELECHLLAYFETVADSLLDRSLLNFHLEGEDSQLRQKSYNVLSGKYREKIYEIFLTRLNNSGTSRDTKLSGFELDQFLESESRRLTDTFFTKKFSKVILYFKNHKRAIFRNYIDRAMNNYFIDYMREQNVKKMKRILLYRDDLPDKLFEYLKNVKGYGNLFYYKKKYDCLSIRDTGKALSVIRKLNLPDNAMEDIKIIFNKSGKRAEYQKIIENITAYIESKCTDERCSHRLTPKNIKTLLYISDYVMQKLLKQTEQDIENAKNRLKECVVCLDIKGFDLAN